MKALIAIYLLYQLSSENVYMEEIQPNNRFSFWAEGSLDEKANEQFQSTGSDSLCRMSTKFDYLYGLDNIWSYAANTCQFTSLDEVSFKSASALQFATYQHARQIVRVQRTTPNCETECRQVYPEWPGASDFGDDSMKMVFVNNTIDATVRLEHPDMPKNPNVHVAKPRKFGPFECECWSNQNVFNLGVDDAEFLFTHAYDSSVGNFGSSKRSGDSDPTSFLVGEGQPEPYRVYEKGTTNRFKVSEVMEAVGSCLDCQPEGPFYMNSLCTDGVCSGDVQPKPTPRVSGAALDITTEYYSHLITMPYGGVYDWIRKSKHQPPFAIHVVRNTEDWTSMGSDIVTVPSDDSKKIFFDIYRYGILLRIQPSKGVIAYFHHYVLVDWLVNALVLVNIPHFLISLLVFYGLGRRSELYLKVKRKNIKVDDLYKSFSMSAMIANGVFEKLSGAAADGNGFITRDDLVLGVSELLKPKLMSKQMHSEQEIDSKIEEYVDTIMVDDYHPEGPDGKPNTSITQKGMSHSAYIQHATTAEPLEWHDLMEKMKDLEGDKELVTKMSGKISQRYSKKVTPE
mmetsp:Transcript_7044/g.12571  ORF Transcript_7044/g.12571 Transcript_7044/m.12571 type:complete len:568 (-) Transcript_7044:434-2137(-)